MYLKSVHFDQAIAITGSLLGFSRRFVGASFDRKPRIDETVTVLVNDLADASITHEQLQTTTMQGGPMSQILQDKR